MNPQPRSNEGDLIAALATGPGPGAIAVLRLSGAGALTAARSFLRGLPAIPQPRRLLRALAIQEGGEPLDDVLAAIFPAPNSYTGEDVVEVHCHGGPAIAGAVQEVALKAGARLAQPGEFTQRAVLHGKMDLLDAEALAAMLAADGAAELLSARRSQKLAPILRELALQARAALIGARGSLDLPLELAVQPIDWRGEAAALRAHLMKLIEAPPLERAFREGIVVALLGPPNAGKSSLFNALVGEERALVDAEAGTTRDAQPCPVFFAGRRFTIMDTAGIQNAEGIAARAVARSLEVSRLAQTIVWVEDASAPPVEPPLAVDLRVLSKRDLVPHPARLALPRSGVESVVHVSALTLEGIAELREAIQSLAPRDSSALSGRQRRLVQSAVAELTAIEESADDRGAEHLARAERSLSELVGGATGQAGLVEASEIYARFCVGK